VSEAASKKTGGGETTMPYRVSRYRLLLVKDGIVPTSWDRQLRQSGDVADLMAGVVAGLDREAFYVVFVDGKNRASGINLVSLGSLTAALVHPREVFKPAIAGSAAALVLVHNHPSGDPSPSAEDIALTKRLCEVGDLVGIKVLDHIVLGDGGSFRSFADEGLLGGSR
jgi:DNA repair protein RadC